MKKQIDINARLFRIESGFEVVSKGSTDKEVFFRFWLFNKFYVEASVGYREK